MKKMNTNQTETTQPNTKQVLNPKCTIKAIFEEVEKNEETQNLLKYRVSINDDAISVLKKAVCEKETPKSEIFGSFIYTRYKVYSAIRGQFSNKDLIFFNKDLIDNKTAVFVVDDDGETLDHFYNVIRQIANYCTTKSKTINLTISGGVENV